MEKILPFLNKIFLILILGIVLNGYSQEGNESDGIMLDPTFTNINAGITGVYGSDSKWGDYDGDGDLDLIITGNYITKIYNNNGGVLSEISTNVIGLNDASVDWGDYDNDGDLDIVISGMTDLPHEMITKIYRNDGSNTFTDIQESNLTGSAACSIHWGDYDNDGDLDILLSGLNPPNGTVGYTAIFRNDNGFFNPASVGIIGVCWTAENDWQDFDNDGDLDIIVSGSATNGTPNPVSKIYRNDGFLEFNDMQVPLIELYQSALACGDYDMDGDIDFILMGKDANNNSKSYLYKNEGSFQFTELQYAIGGGEYCSVEWGDCDNDGDLDLLRNMHDGADIIRNDGNDTFNPLYLGLLGGEQGSVSWGDYDGDDDLDIFISGKDISNNINSTIYRNDITTSNTIPTTPVGLSSQVFPDSVNLLWSPASDLETNQLGLSYNIYLGTFPLSIDLVSPMSNTSNGYRKIVSIGNAGQDTSMMIDSLQNGTYYWSVQSIDNCFAGSPFSAESSFTIGFQPCSGISSVVYSGQTYNTVEIGSQCWMKENLNIGTRIDGSLNQTNNSIIEKYCYNDIESNCNVYGGLYLWNEMMQYVTDTATQGICPNGWHLPTDNEWTILTDNLGGNDVAGGKMKETGTTHWNPPNTGATNSSGFTAFPGGRRSYYENFDYLNFYGFLWSSSEKSTANAWGRLLYYGNDDTYRDDYNEDYGFSVRCLKDTASQPVISADFFGTPTSGTTPLQVQFTDQSIGNPITWEWDFENDGVIDSYIQNPQHIYSVSGLYDVFLKIGNGSTYDSITKTEYINATEPGTPCPDVPSFSYGGQTYNTVLIGDQCWMKEDLNIGTRIDGVYEQTNNSQIEKYCYEDQTSNCDEYGGLYQWNEIMQYTTTQGTQGICPEGWHLPTDTEWITLIDYLGGVDIAGGKMKETGYQHWSSPNTGATDESGFSGIPGGFRSYSGGSFGGLGDRSFIWSSTENSTTHAFSRRLFHDNDDVEKIENTKTLGFLVRCVKDTSSTQTVSANFYAVPTVGQQPLTVNFYDQSIGDPTTWEWDFQNDGVIDNYNQYPSFVYDEVGEYDVYLKVSNGSDDDIQIKYNYIEVTVPQTFTIQTFSSPSNGGTTSGGGNFPPNSTITVSADPSTGYSFVKWTENGSIVSLDSEYIFTVTSDRDLVAHFSQGQQYSVITSSNPPDGGLTSGDGTYNPDESVTVSASAQLGYDFINWTENDIEVSAQEDYTFNITANRVLVANFNADQYNVVLNAEPLVGGDVSGGGTFSYGVPVTVNATPNSGYHFIKWMEGAITVSIDPEYTFTVISNRNLTAIFSENELYTVITSSNPSEGGETAGDGSFAANDEVSVVATSNLGWEFNNWSEISFVVSYDSNYTFNIAESRELTANFSLKEYEVSLTANPSEGGSVSGGGTYTYEAEVSAHAFPADGWKFDYWAESGTIVSYDTVYSFIVTSNIDLEANFSLKELLGISIQYDGLTEVCQGDTLLLEAIVTGGDPPYEYQWSSVPEGITGVQNELTDIPGNSITYFITVKDFDNVEVKDSLSFSVLESPPASIVGKGNPPYMLICVDSGYNYQWYYENSMLSGESKQFYYPGNQGLDVGTYYAMVTNDLGCDTKSNEFLLEKQLDFSIYPNPNEGSFNIIYDLAGTGVNAELIISDMAGKVIEELRIGGSEGSKQFSIAQKGVFVAELRTEGQRVIKKLIIY